MNVSHQGFIFQTRAGTILRHASTTGKVMEVPLIEYLKKFENHPTMKGIHLIPLTSAPKKQASKSFLGTGGRAFSFFKLINS